MHINKVYINKSIAFAIIMLVTLQVVVHSQNSALVFDVNLQNAALSFSKQGVEYLNNSNSESFVLTLIVDNEVHLLNSSPIFSIQTREYSRIPSILWNSRSLVVHLLLFRLDEGAVQLSVVLHNQGTKELSVGARMLFDTILDESDLGGVYTGSTLHSTEKNIILADSALVESRNKKKKRGVVAEELVFALKGDNITTPDRIILANWPGLLKNPWYFRVINDRKLNGSPRHSINSGIAFYYDPTVIPSGQSKVYQIVLGDDANRTYWAYPEIVAAKAILGKNYDILLALLNKIESSIDFIDARSQNNGQLTDDEINQISTTLLETRQDIQLYDSQE